MKRTLVTAVAIAILATTTAASALTLNPRGTGQVLVYPYYTADGGNSTLLAIVNTTANGKAVKVRFHEGYDGRDVLDFNAYLPPHGEWVGAVATTQSGADAPASIVTGDNGCTVPAFAPTSGASTRFLDFSDASYAGTNAASGPSGNSDGGPTGMERTREGHFDVIEMGEVTDGSLTAITPVDGVPADCAQIVAAWSPGGYWLADAMQDMAPPSGGLYGTEFIVDVAQGTMYGINAEAIDGFSAVAQNSAPDSPAPDLNTASKSADGLVSAFVPVDGTMLKLDYQNPVDAVSALFMTAALDNDFYKDPAIGGASDWIVTAPTKRFYVDPAFVGTTAAAPFDRGFLAHYSTGSMTIGSATEQWSSAFPYACDEVDARAYGRDGVEYRIAEANSGGAANGGSVSSSPSLTPCLETSVLTFATRQASGAAGTTFAEPLSVLDSSLLDATDPGAHVAQTFGAVDELPADGYLHLDLTHDADGNLLTTRRLGPAANGDVLSGLPVIGFLAVKYVNANVTPGVLANYSGVARHRSSVACANSASPQGVCS